MSDREFDNINGIKVCDQTARDKIPTKTSQLENDSDYATITQVNQAINNAQLGGGEVDLSGYVTKETGNASQITFADGQTFQAKLEAGTLKGQKGDKGEQGIQGLKGDKGDQGLQGLQGPKGDKGDTGARGQDGLTTNIVVNGNTYTHSNGTITLPNYPTVPTNVSAFTNDAKYASEIFVNNKIAEAQLGGGVNTSGYKVYNVLDYNISTSNEDNTPALQTLMDSVSENGGGTIFFPVGTYKFKKARTQASGTYSGNHVYAVLAKSNVSIVGENIENTILKCTEATPYSLFYRYVGNSNNTIHGCTYSNFTVDCYNTGNNNKVWGKVFFYQYVKDCIFRDLILKGTVATAMGIDYLDNVEINNVTCIDCGRTFVSESSTTGTSGIGIGTGGFENENFKITDCVCVGCGQYGIFIENQHTLNWGGNTDNPKGCIISNCITRNGLYRGIGIRGGTNVIVSNCNSYENAQDGIYLDNKCVNVKVSNNNVIDNNGNGILIKSNSDSVDIDINDNFIKNNTNYGVLLSTATNGLMLRHNVTKGNTNGGLHSDDGLTHSNTIAKNNIFVDGEDTGNIFTGITDFNELLKNTNITITGINCSDFTVRVGATIEVPYSVIPSYADKSKVTISTTDTDYITVNNDAKTVTGVAEGTATLTLTAGEVTTTATVQVANVAPSVNIVNGEITDINNMQITTNNNEINIATTSSTNANGYSVRLTDSLMHELGTPTAAMVSSTDFLVLNAGDEIALDVAITNANPTDWIKSGVIALQFRDSRNNAITATKIILTEDAMSKKITYKATETVNLNYLQLYIGELQANVTLNIAIFMNLTRA